MGSINVGEVIITYDIIITSWSDLSIYKSIIHNLAFYYIIITS